MGRGQVQGQLLFKLNKLTLREVSQSNSRGALEGGDLTSISLSMPKDALLSLALGLPPQRVGTPSLANGLGHP